MSQLATRNEILDALWKIGKVTRPIDVEKQGLYADALESERLTGAQLGDMVMGCVKRLKVGFFPTPAALLDFARPPAINAPSSDGRPYDPIVSLEREIEVETKWLRTHEARQNEYAVRMSRRVIERAQDHVNRRLQERGLAKRYVGVGVEDFGSSDFRGEPAHTSQAGFQDWTRDSEDA